MKVLKFKQRLAILLAATTMASSLSVYGAEYKMHWATQAMNRWVDLGIVVGDAEGDLRPDDQVTRGEIAALIARVFGLTDVADAKAYTDVEEAMWYSEAVAVVSSAELMNDYGDTFQPEAYATREEVAYALANAYRLSGDTEKTFEDEEVVSEWAEKALGAAVAQGVIVGRTETELAPKGSATRAEVITMLDRLTAKLYSVADTYTDDVVGNAVINAADVVLQDMTITGNLYIGQGVGEGDVVLENVQVDGQVIVEGGGINSIEIKGTTQIKSLVVDRADGAVRIVTDETATVQTTAVVTETKLQGNFEAVAITKNVPIILGEGTQIASLSVEKAAAGTTIELAAGAIIKETWVQAPMTVSGEGKMEKVVATEDVAAEDLHIQVEVDKVENTTGEDIKDTITTEKPSTPNTGGGSGSGSGSGNDGSEVTSYSVTGTVKLDGQAVEGVRISAVPYTVDAETGNTHSDYENEIKVNTNANGQYTLTGLKKGQNYSVYGSYGTEAFYASTDRVQVEAISQNVTLDLELKKQASVLFEFVQDGQVDWDTEVAVAIQTNDEDYVWDTKVRTGTSLSSGWEVGDTVTVQVVDERYGYQEIIVEMKELAKNKVTIELVEKDNLPEDAHEAIVDQALKVLSDSIQMDIDREGDNLLATLQKQLHSKGNKAKVTEVAYTSNDRIISRNGAMNYSQADNELVEVSVVVKSGTVTKEKKMTVLADALVNTYYTETERLTTTASALTVGEGDQITFTVTTDSALFIQAGPGNEVETGSANFADIYTQNPVASADGRSLSIKATFHNILAGGRVSMKIDGVWFIDGKARHIELIIKKK